MFAPSKIRVGARAVALALALASSSFSAHAVLQRAGPVSVAPSIGGFPSWYQDTTGLALEFCDPQNQAEVNGGWCLLLPATTGPVPETFPTNFFIEHFYFDATAIIGTRVAGAKALLTLAQEASFTNGSVVIPGQQFTFSRIRIALNPAPVSGTYRFIHPYGEDSFTANVGAKIFRTNDVGLGCGQNFDCALNGRMGPWLLPSATPGGLEMPALTAANPVPDPTVAAPTAYPGTGKSYIADPARIGPVTGSPLPNFIDSTGASRNHNIFRIEGPAGSGLGLAADGVTIVDWIETTNFALAGRVFTGIVPGKFAVDRASYTHSAAGQKLDVFATAAPSGPARIPTAPILPPVAQTLTFFDAPCAGTVDPLTGAILPPFGAPLGAVETPMKVAGSLQWAQTQPVVIPATVCVKDATATNAAGVVVPQYIPHTVTDEVGVTPAFFDPAVGTLTVGATSSDTVLPPTLTLAYGAFLGDLVAGQIAVPNLLAPPASVLMESSDLGITKYQVSTGFAGTTTLVTATNDSFAFPMNSAPQVLNILANDVNAAGGTVTITSAPTLGTAVVNADGTVTFTPNLNAAGADAFTYTVSVGALVSNAAVVSLNITPVNLAPTAVNDAFNAVAGHARTFNLLANDTDPNGAADIRFATIVTPPAGATVTVAGGSVTFTAAAAGTYTFTYQAVDAGGLVSNTATATVTVAATESLIWTKNFYTVAQSKLVASGTLAPIAAQTVQVDFVNAAGVVLGTAGTVATDLVGGFLLQTTPIALPVGTVSLKATTSNGTVLAVALVLK